MSKILDDADYLNIMDLLKKADIGIDSIKFLKKQGNKDTKESLTTIAFHKKYNERREHIGDDYLILDTEESFGTVKYFMIIGFLLDALKLGKICIIDWSKIFKVKNIIKSIARRKISRNF